MRRVLPLALLAVPASARASEGSSGFSFAAGLVQMAGSLAVVLGLIYLMTHLSRRCLQGGAGVRGRRSHIRIVETRHIAPKKSLMLVEIAGEYLLLSNGTDGVSLVKQIDMLEEIEVVEQLGTPPARTRFQEKMEELVARIKTAGQLQLGQRAEG